MNVVTQAATLEDAVNASPSPNQPFFPRKKKRIRGRSIAILVFLTICALFFCVPLYVVVVTSFKTMDEIREGAIFSLPHVWTLEAWDHAWNKACSGIN
jgi:glucose/mannose transport system permease protein